MNWIIIVLILLSIIGSMLWVMPSPRQRVQALLRQQAMRLGVKVKICRVVLPRALGETLVDERDCVAYRMPRIERYRKPRHTAAEPTTWQIFKVRSHANAGLPQDWSWSQGEGRLEPATLALMAELIEALPADIYGLESTPVGVAVYWEERGTPETVASIQQQLHRLLEARL